MFIPALVLACIFTFFASLFCASWRIIQNNWIKRTPPTIPRSFFWRFHTPMRHRRCLNKAMPSQVWWKRVNGGKWKAKIIESSLGMSHTTVTPLSWQNIANFMLLKQNFNIESRNIISDCSLRHLGVLN